MVQNVNYSSAMNLKHIDYFLSKNINLIIDFIFDNSKINLISEKCRSANTNIISIDSYCPGSYFVGINNYMLGKCAGENILNLIQKKWNGKIQNLVICTRKQAGISNFNRGEGLRETFTGVTDFQNLNIFEINIEYESTTYIEEFYSYLEKNRFLGNTVFVFLNEYGLLKMYDYIVKEIPSEKAVIVGCTSSKEVITAFLERGDKHIGGYIEIKAEDYASKIASIINSLQNNLIPMEIHHIDHKWIAISSDRTTTQLSLI